MSPDEMAEKARALLERTRVDAVRELATAAADAVTARATAELAEKGHRAAWRSAARSGWSEADLRALGFSAPAGMPGRPKQPARSADERLDPVAVAAVAREERDFPPGA